MCFKKEFIDRGWNHLLEHRKKEEKQISYREIIRYKLRKV